MGKDFRMWCTIYIYIYIKTLQNRTYIMINADKGGAVTILDLKAYINDANKQLNDPLRYKELMVQLSHMPTP